MLGASAALDQAVNGGVPPLIAASYGGKEAAAAELLSRSAGPAAATTQDHCEVSEGSMALSVVKLVGHSEVAALLRAIFWRTSSLVAVSKFMHEHLATEVRQEIWAGQAARSVTCGCGCVLSWAVPEEVNCLQWHMTAGR